MKNTTNFQHTNTTGEGYDAIHTFDVTIGGETRQVRFCGLGYEVGGNTMAAMVGHGTKVHRADVRVRRDEITGKWNVTVWALGKCRNTRLVGWADQYEGTGQGNVQNNRYRV